MAADLLFMHTNPHHHPSQIVPVIAGAAVTGVVTGGASQNDLLIPKPSVCLCYVDKLEFRASPELSTDRRLLASAIGNFSNSAALLIPQVLTWRNSDLKSHLWRTEDYSSWASRIFNEISSSDYPHH